MKAGSQEISEGIYVYENGIPIKTDTLVLKDEKIIIYFDNLKCPFCKVFDVVWEMLVDDEKIKEKGIKMIRIVCTFFENNCRNPSSKNAFREYRITRSPSLLLLKQQDNKVVEKKELLPSEYGYDYVDIKNAILKFFT